MQSGSSTQASTTFIPSLEEEEAYVSESLWQTAMRRLRRDKLTLIAIGVLIFLTVISALAPVITGQILDVSHTRTDVTNNFLPIGSPGHILGTDDLGRDHLARLLYAGQISLGIGFTAALLTMSIGLVLGVVTGFYGGVIDDLMNWVITTLDSIPALFLLLIIAAILSPSAETLVLVLGLIGWTGITRLVRGETISLRNREFIISARAVGASDWRIMFVHIIPNLFSIVIVTLAINIGTLILVESALSFLGLGVQPPTPTWGNMLTDSQTFFRRAPHLVVLPGVLIVITVLCLYVIGDGVRDALDPTLKDY
jgi:peptide/nickel transport system permease protein